MFPEPLARQLNKMIDTMDRFMTETDFYYQIADLDRSQAVRPDLDLSDWLALNDRTLRRNQGITWVRATFTVPAFCIDIPVSGSQLRIMTENGHALFAPLEVYVDGKCVLSEQAWMDFKCPEGIVSECAQPGEVHTVAFRFDFNEKCYWLNEFSLKIISDAVENNAQHLRSIQEELEYMAHYAGTESLLEKAYGLLDEAVQTGSVRAVREAEAHSRALFEGYRAQVKKNRIYLVGHAHIDMNWFWSMEETRDIVKRDFTTMIELMDRYPDFKFSQSQCATYDIAKEQCPEVYQKICRRAQENRWEVTASTWVEGDLNMVQGESIARQVLYAKAYLSTAFEETSHIMWCPDTFGHPATLPQILKQTGLDYYYHMRCGLGVGSHRDVGFPFLEDSAQTPVYWWNGPDGSRVLVCNTIYNRTLDTRGLLRASRRLNEMGVDKTMLTYGVGDHGGGPTIRDIEWVRTVRDFPTMPELYFSTSEEYYHEMETGDYALPERSGEINFVFDGCYTTHADVKRGNRLCEEKLMSVEKLLTIAQGYGMAYPADALRALWKRTLFNQFHDILDGSGVKDTYLFTAKEYHDILTQLEALEKEALFHLANHFGTGKTGSMIVFNPVGAPVSGTVRTPAMPGKQYHATGTNGENYPCQTDAGEVVIALKEIPASGICAFTLVQSDEEKSAGTVRADEAYYQIETPYYEIEICKANGQITTLYDRKNDWYVVRREESGWRLKKGVLNVLQVHMEEPTPMSGWTIGNVRTIHNLLDGAASEVITDGEVEIRIRFTHTFQASTIVQDIVIAPNSPQIRFETQVDWQEWGDFDRDAPMLKVYFAPAVENRDVVYEVPFGTVTRPADDSEYPSLNWVDIGDPTHGFALLNDCKHGHRCRGNGLEMTLIRSGWLPDQKSDVGEHRFTYAILPHLGTWKDAGIITAAQALNQPMRVVASTGHDEKPFSLFSMDARYAVLSGVKLAEDGKDLIARIYNPQANKDTLTLTCGFTAGSAMAVDLLERPLGEVELTDGEKIVLHLNGYEIKTLRIVRVG
ncbi:MAG: glycoside hydrolase family 38 C-terminal domain-containing protein [Clostridia bacterium]